MAYPLSFPSGTVNVIPFSVTSAAYTLACDEISAVLCSNTTGLPSSPTGNAIAYTGSPSLILSFNPPTVIVAAPPRCIQKVANGLLQPFASASADKAETLAGLALPSLLSRLSASNVMFFPSFAKYTLLFAIFILLPTDRKRSAFPYSSLAIARSLLSPPSAVLFIKTSFTSAFMALFIIDPPFKSAYGAHPE